MLLRIHVGQGLGEVCYLSSFTNISSVTIALSCIDSLHRLLLITHYTVTKYDRRLTSDIAHNSKMTL